MLTLLLPVDGEFHPVAQKVVLQTEQVFHIRLVAGELDTPNVFFNLYKYTVLIKRSSSRQSRCCTMHIRLVAAGELDTPNVFFHLGYTE